MECIRLNDEFETESYSFNNDYMLGEDVGEWTVEEFYADPCDIIQEGIVSRAIFTPERMSGFMKHLNSFIEHHPKAWLSKFIHGIQRMKATERGQVTLNADGAWEYLEGINSKGQRLINLDTGQLIIPDVTLLPQLKKELAKKVQVSGFFNSIRIKSAVFSAFVLAVTITRMIIHDKMLNKAIGRFPTDMAKFCVYITELPEVLSPSDVNHFKEEVRILKKDTKWLADKSFKAKALTPKERKLCELLDDQVDDILKMISNRTDKQRERRMKDRVEQFVETAEEFLNLIHADLDKTVKTETVREYMI